MPVYQRRVLFSIPVGGGTSVNLTDAIDVGDYREVHFSFLVESAGEGADIALTVKHAATNEEAFYVDFEAPVSVPLDATGISWFHATTFQRWIYWFVSGTFSADATVTFDIIAKC